MDIAPHPLDAGRVVRHRPQADRHQGAREGPDAGHRGRAGRAAALCRRTRAQADPDQPGVQCGEVHAARAAASRWWRAAPRNGDFQIMVRDNGPGIPRDKLDKIFTPFSQVDNRYDRQAGGTGPGPGAGAGPGRAAWRPRLAGKRIRPGCSVLSSCRSTARGRGRRGGSLKRKRRELTPAPFPDNCHGRAARAEGPPRDPAIRPNSTS